MNIAGPVCHFPTVLTGCSSAIGINRSAKVADGLRWTFQPSTTTTTTTTTTLLVASVSIFPFGTGVQVRRTQRMGFCYKHGPSALPFHLSHASAVRPVISRAWNRHGLNDSCVCDLHQTTSTKQRFRPVSSKAHKERLVRHHDLCPFNLFHFLLRILPPPPQASIVSSLLIRRTTHGGTSLLRKAWLGVLKHLQASCAVEAIIGRFGPAKSRPLT